MVMIVIQVADSTNIGKAPKPRECWVNIRKQGKSMVLIYIIKDC